MKKTFLTCMILLISGAAPLSGAAAVYAADDLNAKEQICIGSGGSWDAATSTCSNAGSSRTVPSTLQQIMNLLFYVAGAITVLMLIIGGIRYTISGGDQANVTAAKNNIIYALVGMVVVVASYAIAQLVLSFLGAV